MRVAALTAYPYGVMQYAYSLVSPVVSVIASEKDVTIVSLMLCFECGREISEYADVCPGCGYVMNTRPNENAPDDHIEHWLWKHTGWKWRVIGRENLSPGRALVLTDDILEARPLDDGIDDDDSWETCALRRYLNGSFFDELPTAVRQRVVRIHHGNDRVNGDRVFLLSKWEVEIYLKGIDRGGSVATDDEDDSSERYEERQSPLEAWQDDPRKYLQSLHHEWQEEYESVCKDEAWYQEHKWEHNSDREEDRRRFESDRWEKLGWWLRTTGDGTDEVNASVYDMRRFQARHQYSILDDTDGQSRPHSSGSWGFRRLSTSKSSGMRVALCVDVSSCLNPDLEAAVMKPDWREEPYSDPEMDESPF